MKKTISTMRSVFQLKLLAGLATGLVLGLPGMQVQASGFRVPEISTTGMGLSNALVANKDELGAMAYNPAIMAFHEGHTFQIGATMIGYDLSVMPTGGSKTDSTARDTFFIPNLFFSAQTSENVTFGFAMNAPFGLETRWPKGTFPAFSGATYVYEPEHSKINMVNINPSVAIKLDNKTSVALGIMFYDVNSLIFNSQAIDISGSGSGYGWNLAMLHSTKNWDFGLSYKSSVKANLKGSFTTGVGSTPGAYPASASLEFPDMLQIGLLYRINDKFNMEFDIERTGWDIFDKIVIQYAYTSTTTSTNNWENALAYRLGATYEISNKTRLRFGYSLDDTPQPDANFSARVPGNDRQLFSIGIGHDFDGWTLDAAYMRAAVDDRTINSSTVYPSTGTDPNGTSAYNGTYESTINLLGLSISTTF